MKSQAIAATQRFQNPYRLSQRWWGLLLGLMLLSALAMPAWADPPGRVGRLGEMAGQAWVYSNDSGDWIQAVRNRPVTTGDRISTEANGKAEINIGSTVLRVAPNSEIEVLQLDDDHVSLQLHGGSVTARLRNEEAAREFGIATEEGRFRTIKPGHYRFDNLDDISAATAWNGQAVFEGEGTEMPVPQGQRAEFWRQNGIDQYSLTEPKRDDFWGWVVAQEGRDSRSVATRYVSPEMTGVEDLDRHGRWSQTPEYGAVWVPTAVPVNWAPYRMGHWAWVSPWGWTWVDDAPWGFAPFHYGRWVWHRNHWGWAPGRYVARPVYAPALVAWVGGPNLSVSITAGRAPTVGWFPLGPREVYVPSYRVSERYVRQVNVTHVTNITNVTTIVNNPTTVMANTRYANRGLPHAVTVVPASVVQGRKEVAPAMRQVNERVLRDMSRERPRAEAPVQAPPRFAQGPNRQAHDPRVSKPGAIGQVVQAQQRAAQQQAPQPQTTQQPQAQQQSGASPRGPQVAAPQPPRAPEQPRVPQAPQTPRVVSPPQVQAPQTDRAAPQQPNAPRVGRPERVEAAQRPSQQVAPVQPLVQHPERQRDERPRRERDVPGARVPQMPVNNAPAVANAPPPAKPPAAIAPQAPTQHVPQVVRPPQERHAPEARQERREERQQQREQRGGGDVRRSDKGERRFGPN